MDRNSNAGATTLIEALAQLPRDDDRGFRFRTIDGGERYFPWHAVESEARRRGRHLIARGLCKGDRLTIIIAEPHEFVLTFLGAVMAGIVPVPVHPHTSFKAKSAYVQTVVHIVTAVGARMLITQESTRAPIEGILPHLVPALELQTVETVFACADPDLTLPIVEASDLCFLQFTSGSTSMPKGVMVTHANLVANAAAFLGPAGMNLRPDDVAIAWLPLFHDMGLIGFVLGPILQNLPTVLLPTVAFARRPTVWMEAMSKYRGTITVAPNFAYGLAARRCRDRDLDGLDLSKVRIAGCGAEPISANVLRTFAARYEAAGFDRRSLMPCYGMAESTLAISFHAHGTELITDTVSAEALRRGRARPAYADEQKLELVSCGRPFPDHDLTIVSEDGRRLTERDVGEIVVRGPSVTAGYYGDVDTAQRSYRDGALYTGDLGYVANGLVYLCGRLKDLIIIRGANFYPQDLEWAVAEVDGVRRDNVVAFSVTRDGEEHLVIAAEGNAGHAADMRRAIAARVLETCSLRPERVVIVRVGTLPKTSSGKIQRGQARRLYEEGLLEEHSA